MQARQETEPGSGNADFAVVRDAAAAEPSERARMLEAILDAASDYIYVIDRSGHIRYIGHAAAAALGIDREQIVGGTGAALNTPAEVVAASRVEMEAVYATGQPFSGEMSYPTRLGVRDFAYTWSPMRGPDGEITALVLTARDVTERNRAESELRRSEERYRTIVDTTNEGIWMVDARFCTTFVNRRMGEMLGYTAEEMQGASILDFLFDEDRAEMRRRFEERRTGRRATYDFRYRRKDGSELWVLSTTAPTVDAQGRFSGAIGMFADITARRRAEEAVRQREAEVLRLNLALERRLSEIEDLNVRLRRAMSETHHRVKNNLQIVMSLLNLEAERYHAGIPADEVRMVARHVQSLAILHDLLTRQANDDALAQGISLRSAMQQLLAAVEQVTVGRAIHYTVADVTVSLRQSSALAVLVNELIANAVKHGRGDVELEFTVENDTVRLQVCDSGPGFPSGIDPGRDGNTGLEIVELLAGWDLKGNARYENRESGGARVVVEFPLQGDE